ncbi:hypothetical protein M9Y10_004553 [Tritrichomonas musculus]|uniref:Uncharacterized protein n=1 Tax=Tritrichomonas musculus TaxID=1915356 RepID=A0ABR2GNF9_9EUKA
MSEKKNKGGRPLKEIDKKLFEEICEYFEHKVWIAEALGVDEDTLHKWVLKEYKMSFSQYLRQKKRLKDLEISKNQITLAKTNPTMAIWLGKQRLNQKENPNEKNDMGLLPSLMGVIERVANRNTN